ncbi:MAG: ribonuclease HII [Alphaproteobacteria bacterium]
MIIGIDEVGYGPIAGPLVAVALTGIEYLPQTIKQQLDDSKNLTPQKRQTLYDNLKQDNNILFSYAMAEIDDIEQHNILRASHLAMVAAVEKLLPKMDKRHHCLLLDGNKLPKEWQGKNFARSIIKGDGLYTSIAAASIMAKVYRDHLMQNYHQQYPDYGFAKHKGYGTAHHLAQIRAIGPCAIHRPSFLTKILRRKTA